MNSTAKKMMEQPCPISPVWGRVVVIAHNIEDTDPLFKRATAAGIALPDLRQEQVRQVEGILLAKGGNAFDDWAGQVPEPGDKILYDEYAGSNKTVAGVKYQIINDTDILGVMA